MIATKEEKTFKFEHRLKPYMKNKIFILKLSIYSKVMGRVLLAKKDNKELQWYKNNKGKGVGVMLLMVAKHRKDLF